MTPTKFWWTTLLGLLVLAGLLSCAAGRNDAEDITSSVPIGSRLADLDQYLERWDLDSGDVMQWIPTSEPPDSDDLQLRTDGVRISTDYGTFLQKNVGTYYSWNASAEERNKFTGEIVFFHHPHWNAELIAFIYVNGKLVQTDWGYLPG